MWLVTRYVPNLTLPGEQHGDAPLTKSAFDPVANFALFATLQSGNFERR